ncbi:MAG: hypothetical protein V1743_01920 [Nanoarchaeota archaeon]
MAEGSSGSSSSGSNIGDVVRAEKKSSGRPPWRLYIGYGVVALGIVGAWYAMHRERKSAEIKIEHLAPNAVGYWRSGGAEVMMPDLLELRMQDVNGDSLYESVLSFYHPKKNVPQEWLLEYYDSKFHVRNFKVEGEKIIYLPE